MVFMSNDYGGAGGGLSTNDQDQPYSVLPQPHSTAAHIRVVNVGAGAAGLLLAYKMQKDLQNYELVCYEKNPQIGGTWYENRYPGCACDIPAHAYTYTFEPNPDWSSFYAYSPEIRQYFENFAKKYDLMKYVKLKSKVLSAIWVEEKGIYQLEIDIDGQKTKDWCHVLVNGTGFLNNWKWPKIPGLHDFGGHLLHSANWDESCDWEGKNIGIIGTGSSAIQIVPRAQKAAKHLYAFMRSVTWISPTASQKELKMHKEQREPLVGDTLAASKQPEGAQYYFTEDDKKRFREDPEYHLQYRKGLEEEVNSVFPVFISGSDYSKAAEQHMKSEMLRRIGPGHEELKQKLIPSWPPGCRRITPGDGYLEALVQPNCTPVYNEIVRIEKEGVVTENGDFLKLDVLVCATGFNLAFAPSFDVRGTNGVSMKDEFSPEPHVYLAVTVPKFPNYFIINGVRGNWGSGSVLPTHEAQVEYILKCVKRIQTQGIRSLEVKREPVDHLYEHIDAWHQNSVWNAPCKSWYKNNIVGGKLWIWGGSALHYLKTMKEVQWEDYNFQYWNRNKFSFLGNGQIEAELQGNMSLLAPYVRNSDEPWTI